MRLRTYAANDCKLSVCYGCARRQYLISLDPTELPTRFKAVLVIQLLVAVLTRAVCFIPLTFQTAMAIQKTDYVIANFFLAPALAMTLINLREVVMVTRLTCASSIPAASSAEGSRQMGPKTRAARAKIASPASGKHSPVRRNEESDDDIKNVRGKPVRIRVCGGKKKYAQCRNMHAEELQQAQAEEGAVQADEPVIFSTGKKPEDDGRTQRGAGKDNMKALDPFERAAGAALGRSMLLRREAEQQAGRSSANEPPIVDHAALLTPGRKGQHTHYKMLGVWPDADVGAIRRAFHKLSKKWHPDKNPENASEAESVFKAIKGAYEILSEEDKRRNYDKTLLREP